MFLEQFAASFAAIWAMISLFNLSYIIGIYVANKSARVEINHDPFFFTFLFTLCVFGGPITIAFILHVLDKK